MNAGTALNLLLKPNCDIIDQHPLTTAQVTEALASIHQLLFNLLHTCPSDSELAHFYQLANLDTIFRLLERRQHPDCTTLDSWPNLLLLEICDFMHARTSPSVTPYILKGCSDTSLALRRVRLAACSQLPVSRGSFIPFLSSVATSPLSLTMALRLLHLSVVVVPSISPSELSPDLGFLRTLWPSLLEIIECLMGQEQKFHALCLISTIASSEPDIVSLYPFVTRQVQVASLAMSEDVMDQRTCINGMLDVVLVDSPLVQWLLRCHNELEETVLSVPVLYLVGKCLILCASSDGWWRATVVPIMKSYTHELIACIRVLLDSADAACPLPASPLVSAVTRCLGHIQGGQDPILWTSDTDSDLIDMLVRLYFAFEDTGAGVKEDLVVCIFTLSRRYPSTDSTWRGTAIRRILSRVEKYESDMPVMTEPAIYCQSLITDTTSIGLLICASYEADLSRELMDQLHALISTLQTQSSSAYIDMHHLTFIQNLSVLSYCIGPDSRNLSMHAWITPLPLAGPSADSESNFQAYDRFIFVQRVLLLAGRSLLSTLSAERLVAIYHSLIDIMILHLGSDSSCGSEVVGDNATEAILAVLSASTNSIVEYMVSSPWTSLLSQKLLEERHSSLEEMGSNREEVLNILNLVLAGKPKGECEQRGRRRLKLTRTASECLMFFV